MKETIEALTEHEMDVTAFVGFHPYLFYPIGILLAGLIHSGSAVMVMGLSALSAGLNPLESAAALAIGGDLGITATAIIGSLHGTAVQKQVASSHVLFNLITNVLALSLLYPIVWVITEVLGIKSPLYSLVTIHSFTNLLGIVVLFPFIPAITKFLSSKFKKRVRITNYISRVSTNIPDAAIYALHNEILHLAENVMTLNLEGLRIDEEDIASNVEERKRGFTSGSYTDRYNSVKQLQGEALKYFVNIQNEKLDPEDSSRLNQHAHALRHLLKSAKRLKDVTHNIRDFESSGNDVKHGMFEKLRAKLTELYTGVHDLLHVHDQQSYHESLVQLVIQNREIYEHIRTDSYSNARKGHLTEVELATFQNANHEIYSSNKALLEALADMLLTNEELTDFEQLPALS
jgi:phosphate:Na+ symporter